MSPRPYRMGKRADAVAETRRRILDAALEEYAEKGIADASMQGIARRADLAAGTVLYHFPDPDALAEAVISGRAEATRMPMPESVDTSAPLERRVRDFTEAVFAVYAATDLDYQAYQRSREHPVMRRWEEWYNRAYGEGLVRVLGPRHTEPTALQVVSALIDPGFRGSLRLRGLTEEQAVDSTVRLVLGWLSGSGAPTGPGPVAGAPR
ncbi:MAG: TetR/AcrR family transcriptional regulator [Candidatus Nanopelagicales bacterium]